MHETLLKVRVLMSTMNLLLKSNLYVKNEGHFFNKKISTVQKYFLKILKTTIMIELFIWFQ